MATTKADIRQWFERGVEEGHDYMIVVCDTFDHEDYPAYAMKNTFPAQERHYRTASMQRIMEVYDLHQDMEEQLNEHRCFRGP